MIDCFVMQEVKKLKNGMRVHLVPFSGTDAATVLVLTKVGSRYEPDAIWGGSHFIEHLMFKGTTRRPNTIDISRTLDRYGANYNAYTGKDLTGYYVKIDGEKVGVAIDLLHDMMYHSLYDSVEMDKERRVIIEEIKMYEENPIMHLEDLLEDSVFEGGTLGRNIAGTAESMLSMTREDLIAYRDTHYVPSETVIVIAGKVPADAMEQLEATFGTVPEKPEPQPFIESTPKTDRSVIAVNRQFKDVKQIQLGIGFPTVGKRSKDVPAMNLLAQMLGGSMSSRLFIEVRERRGLCYSVAASADQYEDVGLFMVRAGLDAERLPEAFEAIFAELARMLNDGVEEEELQEAKDHVEGRMKLSLENSSSRAEFYGRQELFMHGVKTPAEKIAEYNAVTKEDIARVAKEILKRENVSIAAIGPYETDDALRALVPEVL